MSDENICVYERPNHLQALSVFREQHDFCDVTIKVGRQEMRAHRVILAGAIKYFERMFTADFKERNNDVIPIRNVSEKNMQAIIELSYTGKIVITKENAANLLKDADYLELTDVKDKCAEYLESNIDVDNVCEVAYLAKLLPGCSSLLKRSSSFIRKNLKDVSQTDAFADLDFEVLKAILSEDAPEISPDLIFDAILDWASGDVERETNDLLELCHYVDRLKLTGQSLVKNLIKDQVQNCSGPKYSEFIREALLLYSEPKTEKKSYIFITNYACHQTYCIYDFTNEAWNDVAVSSNGKIAWCRGVVMYKNKLYALSRDNERIMYICDYHVIRTSTQTCTKMDLPFDSRDAHLALLDDCLYVCGVNTNEVWQFSLQTQTWQSVCQTRTKLTVFTLVVLQGHLYAIMGDTKCRMIDEYDPQTNNWTNVCTINLCRTSAAVGLNNKIYLYGGRNENNAPVASVTAFDLKEKRWIEVASMKSARYQQAAVVHEGKIWVIGGLDENCQPQSSVEVYDPSTNLWSYGKPITQPMGYPRAFVFLTNS